jgi:hypothetical protein
MSSDPNKAKQEAQRLFEQPGSKPSGRSRPVPDYEARSREVRKKIAHLRSIRLVAQARGKKSNPNGSAG